MRNSFKNASEDEKGLFFPQRDLSLDIGLPTILAFAHNDTRLIVGVDNGSIYVYDTAKLFSSGSDPISPLRTYNEQPGALRQIAPNPGMELELVDVFAVVRSDGVVHLMNTMLESLGGWSTTDPNAGPVAGEYPRDQFRLHSLIRYAVSWSPKGKHLAIGLQSGDILTFAPNNKSTPNKHIPPTAEGRLVGLNWLSPGYAFRLAYAPQIENEGEPIQQIVSLDTKSNTLTIFDTLYPFTMTDRPQESHAFVLPHWDEDSDAENSKSLVVVGDRASVDLEILGGHSGQWHQQSQENPVSLPLDKQTEETTLMALDVDLTDLSSSTPIVYAYLNDGSLQAWHLEHSKPYPNMVSPMAEATVTMPVTTDTAQDSAMDEKEAANVLSSLSSFNQPPSTSPFGTFGSNSGQQSSVFGTSSQPASVFGQTSQPTFGQSSAFGSLSSGSSTFGQPSTFGSSQPTPSPFGLASSGNAFANIASQRDSSNVFGAPSFMSSSSASPPTQLAPPSEEMTREASMSDGTAPSFGGLSLGGESSGTTDNKPKPGIFGSFDTTPSTNQAPTTSAFGGLIKPAQGFGAFSNFESAASASPFSQEKPAVSAFSSPPQSASHSAFGQTGFGKPAFGQPGFGQAFGQPSFGQSSFGKPVASSTGGFAAFATSSPSSFGSALQGNKATVPTTGGFAAFASGDTSAFGSASKQNQQDASSISSPFASKAEPAKSPFASDGSTPSPFGAGSPGSSPFAKPGNTFAGSTSGFGLGGNVGTTTTPQGSPTKPPPGVMSPPSSPEPARSGSPLDKTAPAPGPSAPASSFLQKPSGFGAFGSLPESSPFFKKPEDKAPAVTAFSGVGPAPVFKPLSSATTAGPVFGAPSKIGTAGTSPFSNASTSGSAFGVTSQLGTASKLVFGSTIPTTTPTKPPASGGFSAFSSGTSALSALAGQKSSFSDLLKSGGKSEKESPQEPTPGTAASEEVERPSTPSKPVSVFASLNSTPAKSSAADVSTTPKTPTPSAPASQEESTTPKGAPSEAKPDPSLSNTSVSSMGSFVDVSADRSYEEVEKEEGEYEGDDTRSFLSSDFSSGPPTDDEASDEEDQLDKSTGKAADVLTPSFDTRSPSSTPQPEVPSIEVTPLPPAEGAGPTKVSGPKEESTTPPGSPSKEAKVPSKSPSPTPFSTPSTPSSPSPSPFGIGLGRPSTRPARSSPLAAAPVSGEDEEEGQVEEEAARKPPSSPDSLPSGLPSGRGEPVKLEDGDVTSKRPKTPPLLSSFGGPAVAKSTPAVSFAPKPEPAKTHLPSLTPSSTPSQQSPSVFSKPPELPTQKPMITPVFASRSESPPAPSTRPPEASQVPKTAPVTPTGSPFSLPPFALAPKPMSAPQSNPATPGPSPMSFKPPVFAQAGPGLFSTAPKQKVEIPSSQATPGLFGVRDSASPFGPQFGPSPASMPQSAPPTFPNKPVAPLTPQLPQGAEEGLQKEFLLLVQVVEGELKEVGLSTLRHNTSELTFISSVGRAWNGSSPESR